MTDLLPYLPRMHARWMTEMPDLRWQELDGSLVFVDVSGFTKMSERLARHGKVGAEEVTDIIGSVFTRLLAVAYGNGGSLLKFGGDALLLWFHGNDHPERAARAAFAMRRELRAIGQIPTTSGKVLLRMSVGVHTGRFHFFLLGGSHRELLITGPAASRTVDMEGAATAGEILLSPELAAVLPPVSLGVPKGPGVLLRREPSGLPADTIESAFSCVDDDLEPGLPLRIRRHLVAGADEPEHRTVTVAFVHFDGTDGMIATDGPPATADALDELLRTIQDAADAHGVAFLSTDIDHDGGKVILTAGAPEATGSDDERMLLTVRQVVEAGTRVPVRIGVHRGPVFAGAVGPSYRRTYTVMGDAVNLAARVMSKAEPGQVLSTSGVIDGSRLRFGTVALEPFSVKGKSKPVQAHAVGPPEEAEPLAGARDELPLVGRDDELATMLGVLADAHRGAGASVELVGEPGIGKSRLLQEVELHAAGMRTLRANGDLFRAATPFGAVRTPLLSLLGLVPGAEDASAALASLVAALAPAQLPWLPLIAIPLGIAVDPTPETTDLDERFRKERLEQTTVEVVRAAVVEPTFWIVEDAHWMDEATRDLLRRMAAELTDVPLALCITRRPWSDPPIGDPARVIELQPLGEDAARTLLEAVAPDASFSSHDTAALVDRAAGNPLFLGELANAARDTADVQSLPSSVEALMAAQIDQLPPIDRRILRFVSVFGNRFPVELAERVIGEELADAGGDDAWGRLDGLLEPEGSLRRFRHALVRDAAYEGLSFRKRKEMHLRVAETVERDGSRRDDRDQLLSFHFWHGGDADKTWRYSVAAGRQAQSAYANSEAVAFYRRAVSSSKTLALPSDEVAEVQRSLAKVHELLGEYREAISALRAERRLVTSDPLAVGRSLLREARLYDRMESWSQVLRRFTRAMNLVADLDGREADQLRAELEVGYAAIKMSQGHHVEAIERYEHAIPIAEAAGAREVVAHAAHLLDRAYAELGRAEEAPYPGLALTIAEELDDLELIADACDNMGLAAYYRGAWDEAVGLYERAREAAQRMGNGWSAAFGNHNIAEIRSDQGRLEEAEPLFRDALRDWGAAGFVHGVAYVRVNMGVLAARAGRGAEGLELLAAGRAELAAKGAGASVVEVDAKTSQALLLQGQTAAAMGLARDAVDRAAALEGAGVWAPMARRVVGEALLVLGDRAAARAELEAAVTSAREHTSRFEEALATNALARLATRAGEPDAPELSERAAASLARLGVVRVFEPPA